MKLSVSLSNSDLELLDRIVSEAGLASRSAGVQLALKSLVDPNLRDAYASAWREWASDSDNLAWDTAVDDGFEELGHAAR